MAEMHLISFISIFNWHFDNTASKTCSQFLFKSETSFLQDLFISFIYLLNRSSMNFTSLFSSAIKQFVRLFVLCSFIHWFQLLILLALPEDRDWQVSQSAKVDWSQIYPLFLLMLGILEQGFKHMDYLSLALCLDMLVVIPQGQGMTIKLDSGSVQEARHYPQMAWLQARTTNQIREFQQMKHFKASRLRIGMIF